MRVQVNSDATVTVDARMKSFVEGEVARVLENFAAGLTRVEVHLSDVNSRKSGPADKRCAVEARPAGARPLGVTATAATVRLAIGQALRKLRRALVAFYGKRGWSTAVGLRSARKAAAAAVAPTKAERPPAKTTAPTSKATPTPAARASSVPAPATADSRPVKRKAIYQARRNPWPAR